MDDEEWDEMAELFQNAEHNARAFDWQWRTDALRLYDRSTCVEEEHLETDIATGEWTERERVNLFARLRMNQLRAIDLRNWNQTDFCNWWRWITK